MVVDAEALVGEAHVHAEAAGGEGVDALGRRQPRTAEDVVDEAYAQQRGVFLLDAHELVAELAGEEQRVEGARHVVWDGVVVRQSRDRAKEAAAVEVEVVRLRQVGRDLRNLLGGVRVVHGQLAVLVDLQSAKPLFPMLLEHHRTLRRVGLEPLRSLVRGVRHGVHRREAHRIEGRRRRGYNDARCGPPRERRRTLPDPIHSAEQHRRTQQDRQRRRGQQVAEELDLQGTRDEEERDEERQQQRQLGAAPPKDFDAGPDQPAQGHEAQQRAEAKQREVPSLVHDGDGVHVLPRVRVVADAADHLALLHDGGDVPA